MTSNEADPRIILRVAKLSTKEAVATGKLSVVLEVRCEVPRHEVALAVQSRLDGYVVYGDVADEMTEVMQEELTETRDRLSVQEALVRALRVQLQERDDEIGRLSQILDDLGAALD